MRATGLVVVVGALLALLVGAAQTYTSHPAQHQRVSHPAGDLLVVHFAHADHVEQNCVVCHHNFVDDTGTGMCFDCHVTDPDVADLIESQFHDLCRGCHVDKQLAGEAHGPTRQCIDCHSKEDLP